MDGTFGTCGTESTNNYLFRAVLKNAKNGTSGTRKKIKQITFLSVLP